MTKEAALSDLYGLNCNKTQSNGYQNPSLPRIVQREAASQQRDKTLRLNSEQQIIVLGLLRFKILTSSHFKIIFDDFENLPARDAKLSTD